MPLWLCNAKYTASHTAVKVFCEFRRILTRPHALQQITPMGRPTSGFAKGSALLGKPAPSKGR